MIEAFYIKPCISIIIICSSKIHLSQLWNHLKNVFSRKQRSSVIFLIVDGIELMDKTKIANAMNSQIISAAVSSLTSQKLDFNTNSCTSFIFSPVSLDPNKSSTPSDITTKSLQLAISSISPSLICILNLSLQSSSVPSCYRRQLMSLLYSRKVYNKQDQNNYRPISAISTLGKILERLVYTPLLDYLTVHNILTPFQSGIHPNHSTKDVLLRTVED